MTDETPNPTEEAAPADAPAGDDGAKARREAARYRTQLRQVEAERDQLAERMTSYQRTEVERAAADKLAKPSDIWLEGDDVDGLLDEDGNVDHTKVTERVDQVLDGRPGLAVNPPPARPRPDPNQGKDTTFAATTSWADALRGDG